MPQIGTPHKASEGTAGQAGGTTGGVSWVSWMGAGGSWGASKAVGALGARGSPSDSPEPHAKRPKLGAKGNRYAACAETERKLPLGAQRGARWSAKLRCFLCKEACGFPQPRMRSPARGYAHAACFAAHHRELRRGSSMLRDGTGGAAAHPAGGAVTIDDDAEEEEVEEPTPVIVATATPLEGNLLLAELARERAARGGAATSTIVAAPRPAVRAPSTRRRVESAATARKRLPVGYIKPLARSESLGLEHVC